MAAIDQIRQSSGDARPLAADEINAKSDLYGYGKCINSLAKWMSECPTPYVIGIYGRWGRGKSTFLETIRNDGDDSSDAHVNFTPWQYQLDTFEDVWMSLITELSQGEGIADHLKDLTRKISLYRNAKRLTGKALELGSKFFKTAEGAKHVYDVLFGDEEEPTNDYLFFSRTKKNLAKAIANFSQDGKKRLFVYVDDLDRCEPIVSVLVLRAIQLLCRIKGVVFLIAVDREVIIRNLAYEYKDFHFASEYLDKMVQLHIEVPQIDFDLIEGAILGNERLELKPYAAWIAQTMNYNPRKLERFVHLYHFLRSLRDGDEKAVIGECVWETVLDVRWPTIVSMARRNAKYDFAFVLDQLGKHPDRRKFAKQVASMGNFDTIIEDDNFFNTQTNFRKIYMEENDEPLYGVQGQGGGWFSEVDPKNWTA